MRNILFICLLISARHGFAQWDDLIPFSAVSRSDTIYRQTFDGQGFGQSSGDSVRGERVVIWLHGLAGNETSWGRVASATESALFHPIPGYPPRKVRSLNPAYYQFENQGMEGVTQSVNTEIATGIYSLGLDSIPWQRNFVIAHSQGGLVARTLRAYTNKYPNLYPSHFAGLITFGTPHQGAQIINSAGPTGKLRQWLLDGCTALGAAEVTRIVGRSFVLDLFISQDDIEDFTSVVCAVFGGTVLEALIDGIVRPVTADYRLGAPFLDSLNSRSDTIPVVVLYGVEEEPVLWRTLYSLTLHDSVNSHNPFNADYDDGFVQYVNAQISIYHALENAFRPMKSVSRTFRKAKEWLIYANVNWKKAIGARTLMPVMEGYTCLCINDLFPGSDNTVLVSSPADCVGDSPGEQCWLMGPSYNLEVLEKPSDGVVLAESAGTLSYASKVILLEHTNHQQMRNSTVTRRELNRLFGGSYYPDIRFFKTALR